MEVAENAVGLDLGKRTYEMCLITKDNKVIRTGGKTDFSGLDKLCTKLSKDDVVAMEACNLAFRIERILSEKVGCRVIILNPGRLAIIFMSTRKTDKEDSMKLARYIRSHEEDEMPVVTPPSNEEWARRKFLSEYRSLKAQRTREINRLHAIFKHVGFTQFTRKDMCVPKNREETAWFFSQETYLWIKSNRRKVSLFVCTKTDSLCTLPKCRLCTSLSSFR